MTDFSICVVFRETPEGDNALMYTPGSLEELLARP